MYYPYAEGCGHPAPCQNVRGGSACSLDTTKENRVIQGMRFVYYIEDDMELGALAGSCVRVYHPSTGMFVPAKLSQE